MKNLILLFFVLLFSQTNAFAQSSFNVPDRDDNQIWHETVVSVPLDDKLSLNFHGILRYGSDASRFVDKRVGFGFTYKFNDNWSATATYFYRKSEFVKGRESYENRFIGLVTPSKKFGDYNVSNRNQFEYHSRNSRSDKWIYRNRTQIEREINLNGFKIKPHASIETFYDSQTETFSRLRFTAGIIKNINKYFTLDAYYLRQQDGQTIPGDLNVFGTTLRITPFAKK